MVMNNQELNIKPCKCGNENVVIETHIIGSDIFYNAYCTKCARVSGTWREPELAIADWNRRMEEYEQSKQ